MCFPSFPELPGGTSLALLLMFACLPVWYNAARARQAHLLDPVAARLAGVIVGCVVVLMLWSLISVFDAPVPFRAARYLASQAAAIALYFLVVGTLTTRRMPVYIELACAGLAITAALSFVGYIHPVIQEAIYRGSDRASGFFKNPNQYGMAISTMLPVLTALILTSRLRRRVRVVGWVLLLLGLVACGSKTNLMISSVTVLAILLAFSVTAYAGAKRLAMVSLSIFGVLALIGVVLFLLTVFNPRTVRLMATFFTQDEELASLVSRDQLWENSIHQFLLDPFLGQGAGQPISIFVDNEFVPHSHNVLLDYLRSLGAPGFLAMLILLCAALALCAAVVLSALRAERVPVGPRMLSIGLATGALAYVAANMSSNSMGPSTSPFFWLVLFMAAASRQALRRREPLDRPVPSPILQNG